MRERVPLLLALAVMVAVSAVRTDAQDIKIDADQKYVVIEVVKLDTFDKEVNAAASQGFRLMMSATSDNGARIQALMERAAEPPDVFQYGLDPVWWTV